MLSKEKRIPRVLFSSILTNGRSFHLPIISIKVLENKDENSRFSFVVSKSVSKSAVKRNLIKRRGYSIIQKHLKNIKSGYLYVFFIKKGVEKSKFAEFEEEIVEILKKTGNL